MMNSAAENQMPPDHKFGFLRFHMYSNETVVVRLAVEVLDRGIQIDIHDGGDVRREY